MTRLTYLTATACSLLLSACGETQQKSSRVADISNWKPGIYSVARKDDGVVLSVVLLAEKKLQVFAGERLLAEHWTVADAPTDVFIAVQDGGLIFGSGITTIADPLHLGEVVFSNGLPNLKAGVNDIVLGTLDGQVPLGVRLIPCTETEMRAIRNSEPPKKEGETIKTDGEIEKKTKAMKINECPKCGSKEIFCGCVQGRSGCNTNEFIRVSYMSKVELTHYVCGECGYTESYIEDPRSLNEIRSKWTQSQ